MLKNKIKGSNGLRTHDHRGSVCTFSLDSISDGYDMNKSVHDYPKCKKLPQVFTVTTRVRKEEYRKKIDDALRNKSKLISKDWISNNYPKIANIPGFFSRRNESLDKIIEKSNRFERKLPRSSSQLRSKSI
jgi:hypothetical protein